MPIGTSKQEDIKRILAYSSIVAVVALTALATLVLGLFWNPLIELAERATIFYG